MMKKILCIMLACFLLMPIFADQRFILAEDDEEEEKSDYEKCVVDKDRTACSIIAADTQNDLKEIEEQIENAKNDREKAEQLAREYAEKAQSMQANINRLAKEIDELKEKIDVLETQIAQNEQRVDALNSRVRARMVQAQKTMHFNGYLEFILGSKSFSDMLSRIYGVEAIASKDESDRSLLLSVIEQLGKDKAELDEAKTALDANYNEIVARQAELLAMQEFYEEEEARIQNELDVMTEERDNIYESFEDLQDTLREVGVTSAGFVAAVHNSTIVATVWNYSPDFLDGRWHLGVDYAASRGTEIHAPASGIIIRADDSCADPGYLGSACGYWISGGGNQVYMMCEVAGKVYGIIFFHLNTVNVKYGDYLLQDDIIGTVGSSGCSTGPHCHIEMYYLGSGYLMDFVAMGWNATFSVGRGATAYNNRCYYDDGSFRQGAPCILNPEWYLP